MQPYANLVIPFDFSENAERTVRLAKKLAEQWQAKLHLVHAMHLPLVSEGSPTYSYNEVLASLKRHLEEKAQRWLDLEKITATFALRADHIEDWIDDFVSGLESPLIVMGKHGWSKSATGIGPTTKRILRSSKNPVWLVSGEDQDMYRVIAAVDMGPGTDTLAETAKKVTQGLRGHLSLVYVRDRSKDLGYLNDVAWHGPLPELEGLRTDAFDDLKALAERTAESGMKVEMELLEGRAAEAIEKEAAAKKAGLIVCAKHAKGTLERLFLGSVTEDLARTAKRDLLVIPLS